MSGTPQFPLQTVWLKGDYVYFGQNKMIIYLNTQSRETVFFTNKIDEEIATLINIW